MPPAAIKTGDLNMTLPLSGNDAAPTEGRTARVRRPHAQPALARFFGGASRGVLAAATLAAAPALAQSTGSIAFDQLEIVVSGAQAVSGVGGVLVPDTTKTRQVLTQEFIKNQRSGQSIDDIINMMPGVSFQNNDPYGSSGGTLSIHGFDASRISQTFDGIPLNDTGNYALYSSQQLDSELIDQVNVSLGSTDIDSPTASATGSTVNYTTRKPTEDFHARLAGSAGEYDYFRIFGVIDTGVFTPFGTRMFVAASHSENVNPFNRASKIDKNQYNAKLYQPIGSNGDFVSIAGHYNVSRNGNFSSMPLRVDRAIIDSKTGAITGPRLVGSGSVNRFPTNRGEREYDLGACNTDVPQAGVADAPNTCGTAFDYSFNPSNTGNIRINSRFTLADGLVLTVDPSFQYVKANGGLSAVQGFEGGFTRKAAAGVLPIATPLTGYIGGKPYFGGVDLNGDGDTLDSVELYAPSNTMTNRFGVIANLQYEITPTQNVRINYTWDHGRHRQTGEVGTLKSNGYATYYFPIDNPLLDATGRPMEKRNRLSYAILNQVSGEYRGQFLDNRLSIDLGLRAPFFTRDLNNYCVAESGGNGFVDCFNDTAAQAAFLAANPAYSAPQSRHIHYDKLLPSAGASFDFTPKVSAYASYSKGLQVPGTDNLYNAFSFPASDPLSKPRPETTDNFNLGVRYKSRKVQAELSGWYTVFNNRLASSYDPINNVTTYRNLGTVHKYGIDGSVAYRPIPELTLYAFGSYLKSKILDNVQTGLCTPTTAPSPPPLGACTIGQPIFALTEGKRESGAPVYTLGGRAQGNLGPVELGVQVKRTGSRYVNDQNLPIYQSFGSGAGTTFYQVYGAKTPAYTLVDLDARVSLGFLGMNDQTYFQLNVTNLFDKFYVGGFTGNTDATKIPNTYIGTPRTVSGTINFAF